MEKSKNFSVAAATRRRILRSREKFWRVEDFDGDPKAVEMALLRLVDAGEIERVRRGVYWRGKRTRFGRTLASDLGAVREIVGSHEAVGAAGWYATNLLGLSTQVSPRPVIAVTRRVPKGLAGVRFVNRSSRTGRRDAQLNEAEVTFLEALEGWDRYVEVGPEAAVRTLVDALGTNSLRISRLVEASGTESSRVRERLRFVLEQAGEIAAARKVEGARSRTGRQSALAVTGQVAT